jgi:Tol biopolymer transport system component
MRTAATFTTVRRAIHDTTMLMALLATGVLAAEPSSDVSSLSEEVRTKGWIVVPARSDRGDWDLFVMRPNGTERRRFTSTPQWNEAAPQFSRDSRRLLYRRLKREEKIEGNRYGEQGSVVVANTDGTGERVLAGEGELPWASWSPDGREFATLSVKGISFVDANTGQALRMLPRKGFFQQVTWSPDGKYLIGVANSFGTGWSVARMNSITGVVSPVKTVDCCTPDWSPDSRTVVFSWRPPDQKENRGQGWTQLWRADPEGTNRQLVYGEDGRHIYGGHISPDGRYALFTGNPEEDGDPQHAGAPMGLVRLSDTPIIGGVSKELRALHPAARSGPCLALPPGWEPCWTFSEIPGETGTSTAAAKP